MDFAADGCTLGPYVPGQCTGPTQADCPGAFVGTDATDGTVFQCSASNVGVSRNPAFPRSALFADLAVKLTITFC